MVTVPVMLWRWSASCCHSVDDPAGQADLPSLLESGVAEPRGARLGVAGRSAVASGMASPLSAHEERWAR
jgi:hypothetical protein